MASRAYTTLPGPPPKSPPLLRRSRSGASRFFHSTITLENSLVSPNTNTTTNPAARRAASAIRSRSRSVTKPQVPSDGDTTALRHSQQRDSKENRENPSATSFGWPQKIAGPLQAAEVGASKQRKASHSTGSMEEAESGALPVWPASFSSPGVRGAPSSPALSSASSNEAPICVEVPRKDCLQPLLLRNPSTRCSKQPWLSTPRSSPKWRSLTITSSPFPRTLP